MIILDEHIALRS